MAKEKNIGSQASDAEAKIILISALNSKYFVTYIRTLNCERKKLLTPILKHCMTFCA
jgi:hypothetical protein